MNNFKINFRFLTMLNGILAIVFGLVAIIFPTITLYALALYFAISIIIGGVALSIGSYQQRNTHSNWPLSLFEGLVGLILGFIILFNPKASATAFVIIVGVWAVLMGLVFLVMYFGKRIPKPQTGFMLANGVASIIIGLLIFINPFESTRVITILIGAYALAYGVYSMVNNAKTRRTKW